MKTAEIIEFPNETKRKRKRDKINSGKKGRVFVRNGRLWVDFYYLGERVRESSGLTDTWENRKDLRRQLNQIMAEIENEVFDFAKRFPHSKKKEHFIELEGKTYKKDPKDITFGEYAQGWWEAMSSGMSSSQKRDYTSILNYHLLPYFADVPLSDFNKVFIKKYVAHLKGQKNRFDQTLSSKRIMNVMIPLRVIVKDAIAQYGWTEFPDPFHGLKIPNGNRKRIQPFNLDEWKILIKNMNAWYVPYFEFSVGTGLRPSEQVALKWSAIDDKFIHIERSRVRNEEKTDLKTQGSHRRIKITSSHENVLEKQKELTKRFNSPYVFVNTYGRPILQDKLREMWARVIKKSGVPYRRMYEIRHTFASWALAGGESPEWVAGVLGHTDTSMVYKTYGCYIPNMTRRDGSAFEQIYRESSSICVTSNRHNDRHIR